MDVDFSAPTSSSSVPEPSAYDLVLVFFLQIPASERTLVLGRAAQALAPGGTLLVVGHDLVNLTDGVGGPRDPSLLYTPAAVVADVAGLEIERAERLLRDVEDSDRPAIDAFVRAHAPARDATPVSRSRPPRAAAGTR